MDAREALASAGSGRPWFLLRWHPPTAVSTGRHHLAGRSAMVALDLYHVVLVKDVCTYASLVALARTTTVEEKVALP